ncbi:ABC transporter substrate-binding protein [Defluviitalea saccharophila]|uniref:ABC transporter substrate-binding protein n=1 Tax=Defluviitalea saccharophila TaxID=879970 RepID=A0ABZ2Y513_9FIRM
MKKLLATILTVVLGVSVLAGCGNSNKSETSDTSSQSEQTSAVSQAKEPKELTFWHYFTSINGETVQKYVDEYNAMQDDVKINFEFVPRDELLKQFTIGLVSGELPDMTFVDNPDHASFSAMGLFADITDKVQAWEDGNKFLEGALNSAKYNGRIYGLPHASNALALYYDVDMLAAAGVQPPETWEELEAAAAKLTSGNTYGLAFSAIKNEEGTFQMLPFLLSSGATVDTLDSAGGVKALTFLSDLTNKGYVSKEVLNWAQGDVEKQFVSGNAAMIINGPWIKANLQKNAPDKNWAVTKLPKDKEFASTLGGENIVILNNSEVTDEAWEFLKWFMSKENNIEFCKTVGRFSPRSDVTPEEVWGDDAVMKVFADQMQYAQPRGPHPKWPEVSAVIINAVQESLSGVKEPAQALKDAQVKIDEINSTLK